MRILDDKKQQTTRDDTAHDTRLRVYIPGNRPHWLRSTPLQSWASFEAKLIKGTGTLSLHASESYNKEQAEQGSGARHAPTRTVCKETVLDLSEDSARALYAMLRERFEPEAVAKAAADAEALQRIADALGTGETGEGLVSVARAAHTAESQNAAIVRAVENAGSANAALDAVRAILQLDA